MMWVLENTQAKIREFFEKILGLVTCFFKLRTRITTYLMI